MKNSNYSFKKIIGRFWYLFLLGAVLSSTILSLSVTFFTRPSSKEKFSYFFAINESKVEMTLLEEKTKEICPGLKKVTITCSDPSSSMHSSYLETYASNADLLFFPLASLASLSTKDYLALPSKYQESTNFVDKSQVSKGYLVKDGTRNYFSKYVTWGEDKYYMFISASSTHISSFMSDKETNYVETILEEVLA